VFSTVTIGDVQEMNTMKMLLSSAVLVAALASIMWTSSAHAQRVPDGWTQECRGSTSYWFGPNGSFLIWPNSRFCQIP
jgi:hypothetical protein